MKIKCRYFIILLISLFIITLYFGINKYNRDIKINGLLHDMMSHSVLYAMNKNNNKGAKSILASNLTNLVFNYDKELFSESRGLSRLCNDWEKGFKDIVLKDIKQKGFDGTTYQKSVLKKINLINLDCKIKLAHVK